MSVDAHLQNMEQLKSDWRHALRNVKFNIIRLQHKQWSDTKTNSSGAFILKVSLNAVDLTTEEIVLFSRGGRTRRPRGGPAGPLQFAVTPACVLLKHLDQNDTRGSVPTRWPRVSENINTRRIKTDRKQTAGSKGPKHQSSGIKLEHKMLLILCIIAPELSQCVYQLIYWSGNSEVLVLDRLSNIWTVFTHKT